MSSGGPRLLARVRAAALFAAAGAALAGSALAGCSSAGSSTSTSGSHSGLVGYPAFLPRNTLNVHSDGVLVGTVERPALTSQGDGVKVVTRDWSVLAVVNGPEVPGEGLPFQTPATTCTWTVELSEATGRVPIAIADFDTTDAYGQVFHPYLVPGQKAPPRVLTPKESVRFEIRAGEPVGEGVMRWAPDGRRIVAMWDFVVEND